jgi:type IX secretion system PorP/SprF family membrane protein
MMKTILKITILLLIPISLSGQLTPVTDHYILNPLSINPAFAGNRGALNIAAFYRKQWVGISGSPRTMTLALDAPVLRSKLGLGLMIVNDEIGVSKETQIATMYSFKIAMNEGSLSLGLGAGILTTNTAWSDLIVLDPGDEYYLIDSRVFAVPDFSFGAYYTYGNYFAGFSIPRLLSYKFNFDKNKFSLMFKPGNYSYMLNTGYVFDLSSKVKMFPSVLVIYTPENKLLYDINAHFSLFDRLWTGVSYQSDRSVAALLQFAVNNQIRIGYTYDFDFGKLGRYSSGSHEVMLRYEFRYKVDVVNPLIF